MLGKPNIPIEKEPSPIATIRTSILILVFGKLAACNLIPSTSQTLTPTVETTPTIRDTSIVKPIETATVIPTPTETLTPMEGSRFHARPFLVIQSDRFVNAIRAKIRDKGVLALPEHLGAIDQFVDSTDTIKYLDRFKQIFEGTAIEKS